MEIEHSHIADSKNRLCGLIEEFFAIRLPSCSRLSSLDTAFQNKMDLPLIPFNGVFVPMTGPE